MPLPPITPDRIVVRDNIAINTPGEHAALEWGKRRGFEDGIAAAIAALREPSEEMVEGAAKRVWATLPDGVEVYESLPDKSAVRNEVRAALAAAADVLEKGVKP